MKPAALILSLILLSTSVHGYNGLSLYNWVRFIGKVLDKTSPEEVAFYFNAATTSTTSTTLASSTTTGKTAETTVPDLVATQTSTTIPPTSSSTSSVKESTTSTTTSTSTTTTTTSTLARETCFDGILNQDEILPDCAGLCYSHCDILDISRGEEKRFKRFAFKYESSVLSDRGSRHRIKMTNPQGVSLIKHLDDQGSGQIETVKYTLIGSKDMMVRLMVEYDEELASKATLGDLLMVGSRMGSFDCKTNGFCERTYHGYKITLLDKQSQRYLVTTPDGAEARVTLSEDRMATPDNILGLKTIVKYMPGGYSLIEAWTIT